MAYVRRNVSDGVSVMNADLYNNVQDGIDEAKLAAETAQTAVSDLGDDVESVQGDITSLGSDVIDLSGSVNTLEGRTDILEQDVTNNRIGYDTNTQYLTIGHVAETIITDEGGDGEYDDEEDVVTPTDAASIFDEAESNSGS